MQKWLDMCIDQQLSEIDLETFPTLSDLRQRFLFIKRLIQGLMQVGAIDLNSLVNHQPFGLNRSVFRL